VNSLFAVLPEILLNTGEVLKDFVPDMDCVLLKSTKLLEEGTTAHVVCGGVVVTSLIVNA
tara:strand:+ start:1323 stop:1502 length:180 start_codon:yes stop_codon:yes gene_type:complete